MYAGFLPATPETQYLANSDRQLSMGIQKSPQSSCSNHSSKLNYNPTAANQP